MPKPRQAKLDALGALHHVIGRGIEGSPVFRTDFDRADFLGRVEALCQDGNWVVYAWALRRRGRGTVSDERLLGSSGFVTRLFLEAEEREKETLKLQKNIPDLGLLGERIVKEEGIREDDLRSGSRRREVIEARKLFCQLAVKKMGYCGGDVARSLGVTTSTVNKAANSGEVAALQQYC